VAYLHVQSTRDVRGEMSAQCLCKPFNDAPADVWGERISPLGQDRSGDPFFAEPPDEINLSDAQPQAGKNARRDHRTDATARPAAFLDADQQEKERVARTGGALPFHSEKKPKSFFAVGATYTPVECRRGNGTDSIDR